MVYSTPWRRTYAEWNFDESGWHPVTNQLEPWSSYLRRCAMRVWHGFGGRIKLRWQ